MKTHWSVGDRIILEPYGEGHVTEVLRGGLFLRVQWPMFDTSQLVTTARSQWWKGRLMSNVAQLPQIDDDLYRHARAEYADRYANLAAGKRNWQFAALGFFLVAVMTSAIAIIQVRKPAEVPFVVALDRSDGYAITFPTPPTASGTAIDLNQVEEETVAAFIRSARAVINQVIRPFKTARNEGDFMRKLKRIAVLTGPLLLCAGAAWASTSGVPAVDTALNTLGRVAEATGFMIGGVGTIGIIHHVRSGSWLGAAEHLGLATTGGAIVYNYPTIATVFGGNAAALVHSAVSHPAAHLAVHAAARLVS